MTDAGKKRACPPRGPVDWDIISKYCTGIMTYQITDSRDAA